MDLTIAVLSWRQPKTLRNSLESYQRNGLLDLAAQKLIFFNEVSAEDVKIAKEFGFEVLSAKKNIGIGIPFQKLVEHATGKYFLFLENDFMLVENAAITRQRLEEAIRLIEKDGISAVRMRHRYHYGDPNMYLKGIWNGSLQPENPTLDGVYWWQDVSKAYPGIAEKVTRCGEDFFIMPTQYSGYTNNPTLYATDFLREHILPMKFTTTDVIENKIGDWWYKSDMKAAMGTGLFKHNPIELSGSAFANYKRIKTPVKNWMHYILRFGIRGRVMNLFLLQFLPLLIKVNINFGNKFMVNLSLGRYESV